MAKKIKEAVNVNDVNDREELVGLLADSLNSGIKGDKIAFVLSRDQSVPADITGWISTGSDILDIAVSNMPHGGLPLARIVEITGFESSGKSLLALHICKSTQEQGGIAVYLDTESSMNRQFAKAIGVDISMMMYSQPDYLEQLYESIEKIVEKVKAIGSNKPVTIIADTIMATPTKAELEGDFDKDGWSTGKAIINSKAMRKLTNLIAKNKVLLVFVNQLRDRLGVSFGETAGTSGGHAIKFHSTIRIQLKKTGSIKAKVNGVEQIIGISTQAKVTKSKIGPPLRVAKFDIYFDSGINNIGSWLATMADYDLVDQGGAWYTYTTNDGEIIKFQEKTFQEKILSNPILKEEIYMKICDKLIMSYRSENINPEDLIIDSDDSSEDVD